MSERTEQRILRNNEVFKDANERIREAAERFDHALERLPFLCECPVEDCVEIIRLSRDEYTDMRANPNYYVTARGHESAEKPIGRVVAENDGYVVVEKS